MPFCPKCGTAVADGAAFCPGCGAPQGASVSAPSAAPAGAPAASQLDEKVAGMLCYLVFWVTGLIFYFIDTRPYVRFHAAQSIVLFGGLTIIRVVFGVFLAFTFFAGGWSGLFLVSGILWLLYLAGLVLWIILMIKAYQGERFRVPIAADIADKLFGKS